MIAPQPAPISHRPSGLPWSGRAFAPLSNNPRGGDKSRPINQHRWRRQWIIQCTPPSSACVPGRQCATRPDGGFRSPVPHRLLKQDASESAGHILPEHFLDSHHDCSQSQRTRGVRKPAQRRNPDGDDASIRAAPGTRSRQHPVRSLQDRPRQARTDARRRSYMEGRQGTQIRRQPRTGPRPGTAGFAQPDPGRAAQGTPLVV